MRSFNQQEGVKNWHQSEFKDELGKEINPTATFKELKSNIPNVYDYLNVYDSLIRERVFSELAERMNVDYNEIYKNWLNG